MSIDTHAWIGPEKTGAIDVDALVAQLRAQPAWLEVLIARFGHR